MFDITNEDIQAIVDTAVESMTPLVFKMIPAKEKKKYIILCMVVHFFEANKKYSEKEVNLILKPMFEDYVMIRRYLVDYHFLDRTTDGKEYWLVANHADYEKFDVRKMI
ncbi:MAG: DUF2087 domain-containing protein [Firmicutes bacterium]|nr:DUF2087 domain-containing protein [Bacillota bacterium]